MRNSIARWLPFSNRQRLLYWGGILARFTSVQVVVQLVSFVAGILVIRGTGKPEYALYTVATALLGAMAVLGDSGISSGISAQAGKVWKDRQNFSRLITTALRLRRRLGSVFILITGAVGFWMFLRNGASLTYASVLTLVVVVTGLVALVSAILKIVPRFFSEPSVLQRADLVWCGSRLMMLLLIYKWLNALTASLAALASALLLNRILRGYVGSKLDIGAAQDEEHRRVMLKAVRQRMPLSIFYVLQGQIVILLVTIFGRSQEVAEVGALGRIAMILAVLDAVFINLIAPRFSKCQDPSRLPVIYFQSIGAYIFVALLPLVPLVLFPEQVLWILGAGYGHLSRELIVLVAGAVLGAIGRGLYNLNASRAWLGFTWSQMTAIAVWMAILISVMDFRTTLGAVSFSALMPIPGIIFILIRAGRGFATGR